MSPRLDELEQRATLLKQPQPVGPGTIVFTGDESARFTRSAICGQGVIVQGMPPGTTVRWKLGSDITEARNETCAEIIGDWIWFMDDDHAYASDLLLRLLQRNVDIVGPLCLRRIQPFLPTAAVDGDYMDITRYGPEELVEVEHTGSSGMLIRRRVIEAMEAPWFEMDHEDDGRPVSEDVYFCRKARAAGFDIHVDMGARLGHMTAATVWPFHDESEDRWLTGFDVADGAKLWIGVSTPHTVAASVGGEQPPEVP